MVQLRLQSWNKRLFTCSTFIQMFLNHECLFYLKELHGGQDADILKKAIVDVFTENDMEDALQKIIFVGSDGTATSSGLNLGLITKVKEDFARIAFIWCLSHRLELAMEDALKDFMAPVDNSFVLHKNSSNKLSQLKSLFDSRREVYEFESKSIKPAKSTGSRWLDHKARAMTKLNDKFGVYVNMLCKYRMRLKKNAPQQTKLFFKEN